MRRIYDIIVVVTLVVTTFFTHPTLYSQSSKAAKREVEKYRKFMTLLSEHHNDSLDYHEITERAINAALEMCDPHSQYLLKQGGDMLKSEIESAPIECGYMVDSTTLCVKVARFSRNTRDMVLFKYLEANSPETYILDLRGNKGGLVQEAILTAELFLKRGDLILTRKGRTVPTQNIKAKENGELKDAKLIVLIDRATASASEIVVGALKDHDRATIVGERSYGKGLIMKQYSLDDSTSVVLAIAHYLTPDSHNIQSNYEGRSVDKESGGIAPTIEMKCGEIIDSEDLRRIYEAQNKK